MHAACGDGEYMSFIDEIEDPLLRDERDVLIASQQGAVDVAND